MHIGTTTGTTTLQTLGSGVHFIRAESMPDNAVIYCDTSISGDTGVGSVGLSGSHTDNLFVHNEGPLNTILAAPYLSDREKIAVWKLIAQHEELREAYLELRETYDFEESLRLLQTLPTYTRLKLERESE